MWRDSEKKRVNFKNLSERLVGRAGRLWRLLDDQLDPPRRVGLRDVPDRFLFEGEVVNC